MIALKKEYNRDQLFKTLHQWPTDILNFDFLDKGLGVVPLTCFMYDFSTKIFLIVYSVNWPNLIVWLPLLREILGNVCIAIVYYPGYDVMDFKINLIFLIEPFSQHDQKVMIKIYIYWERKELLRWNKKHFSSFLKGFQLSKIVSDLRVRL